MKMLIAMMAAVVACFKAHKPRVEFCNVGEGTEESGQKTYIADAATSYRYLMYKVGTDADHSAITGAGDDPIGPSDDQAVAGEPIAINVCGARKGLLRVVTDGTISDGDWLKCGATGYATKATTGDVVFGRARFGTDTTSAAGDVIPFIPVVPGKHPF